MSDVLISRPVGSANKITWIESRHKGQPDLYVEISMDEQEVQRTRVVAQNIAPSWDEELTVYDQCPNRDCLLT
jgi:hypothetical protein